jgi:hypothetical protein
LPAATEVHAGRFGPWLIEGAPSHHSGSDPGQAFPTEVPLPYHLDAPRFPVSERQPQQTWDASQQKALASESTYPDGLSAPFAEDNLEDPGNPSAFTASVSETLNFDNLTFDDKDLQFWMPPPVDGTLMNLFGDQSFTAQYGDHLLPPWLPEPQFDFDFDGGLPQVLPQVNATLAGVPVVSATPAHSQRVACSFNGCDKTFVRAADCRRHMRNHTGAYDHSCDVNGCGKAFTRADKLRDHKRRRH